MDNNERIGIIGAMDIEIAQLRDHMDALEVERIFGMEFYVGRLCGTDVVVAFSGEAKVNAALCACLLIDHFGVAQIINTGVAGSLDARINIGDMVLSTEVVHHDLDLTSLGYELGQVPNMDVLGFPTSDELRAAAQAAAADVAPEVTVYEGVVATGECFVSADEQKRLIAEHFGALCCEMEAAAIAQVCYMAQVPVLILRVISDKADGSADMDYPTFKVAAADRCARIVERLVAKS